MVETSDEWITSRTGIKQRRKAAPRANTLLQFAVARRRVRPSNALACNLLDVDLILCATVTPDQILPSIRLHHSGGVGREQSRAMDLVGSVFRFLYGPDVADAMIRTGLSKYALVNWR